MNSRSAIQVSSVAQSCLTLWLQGLQHARPPCPSPTSGVYSNSCPLSRWCHPTISSSVWILIQDQWYINLFCEIGKVFSQLPYCLNRKKYHDVLQTVQRGEIVLKLSHDGKEMRIIPLAELGIHISTILGSDDSQEVI